MVWTQVRHGLTKSDCPCERSPEKGLWLVVNDNILSHSHHLWCWLLHRLSKLQLPPPTVLLTWLQSPRQSNFIKHFEFLLPALENISYLSYLKGTQHPNSLVTSHKMECSGKGGGGAKFKMHNTVRNLKLQPQVQLQILNSLHKREKFVIEEPWIVLFEQQNYEKWLSRNFQKQGVRLNNSNSSLS